MLNTEYSNLSTVLQSRANQSEANNTKTKQSKRVLKYTLYKGVKLCLKLHSKLLNIIIEVKNYEKKRSANTLSPMRNEALFLN